MTKSTPSASSLLSLFLVYIALMILLALTTWAAGMPLGIYSLPVSLAIAIAKTLLVIIFFMHIKKEKHIVWVFATAGFLWLAIFMVLSGADVTTRGFLSRADELNPNASIPSLPPGLSQRQSPLTPHPINFQNP